MCGRYYMDSEDMPEAAAQLFALLEQYLGKAIPNGEIFPSQSIPVFVPGGAEMMEWGFSGKAGGRIINARSETILSRPMFASHVKTERVIVPASGFYEWKKADGQSQKYAIHHPREPLLMAGIMRRVNGTCQVVILTKSAQGSMKQVHDRMPVLFTREQARQWIARRTAMSTVCALMEADTPEVVLQNLQDVRS